MNASVPSTLRRLVSRYSVEAPTRIECQLVVLVMTVCPWKPLVPGAAQGGKPGIALGSQATCVSHVASYFVCQN